VDRQPHYKHLADAVQHLERVHAAGCRFGSLLTTRDREQFVSHTAEVFVADDLMHRGYTVQTVARSTQASPDLHVTGYGIDLAVEVYSPRELTAIDEWVNEVKDVTTYLDVRASYDSSVTTALEQSIPPSRSPVDPWAPVEMLEQTREEVISEIRHDVETALRALQPLRKVYRHRGTPLHTSVELDNVRLADAFPVRGSSISYPGLTGYSPAGVFRTVVERALRKARRRQAHGVDAAARALVVYLMGTKIAEDLVHPAHTKDAEAALDGIDPQQYGLDAIAFVVRALPRGLAFVFAVVDDTTLTTADVQAMFGASSERDSRSAPGSARDEHSGHP
jgi:hypothetical protein